MSSQETHPAEEGHGSGPERLVEEDAQRYPGHEAPDKAREDVGLGEGRQGAPEGAPAPEPDGRNAPDERSS